MLDVFYSTRFKKDYKQAKKQGLDTEKLLDVVDLLAAQKQLPPELKDHSLSGNYNGYVFVFGSFDHVNLWVGVVVWFNPQS